MDHDSIDSGLEVLRGPVQCVFHRFSGDQAFNACDDHKFTAFLNAFSPPDFLGKDFRFLKVLLYASLQAVAFGKNFVFYDDRRHTGTLKLGDGIFESVCVSSCIAVNDHGFVGYSKDFVDGVEPGVKGDDLDIGMAFRSRVGETAFPDGIKLPDNGLSIRFPGYFSCIGDDAAQPIMGLKYPNSFTGFQQGFEFSPALFWENIVKKGHDWAPAVLSSSIFSRIQSAT